MNTQLQERPVEVVTQPSRTTNPNPTPTPRPTQKGRRMVAIGAGAVLALATGFIVANDGNDGSPLADQPTTPANATYTEAGPDFENWLSNSGLSFVIEATPAEPCLPSSSTCVPEPITGSTNTSTLNSFNACLPSSSFCKPGEASTATQPTAPASDSYTEARQDAGKWVSDSGTSFMPR